MDLQPMQMTEKEKIFSKNAILTYKGIEDVVLHGDLYRLLSPYAGGRTALMYASEDSTKAVVFSYFLQQSINGDQTVLQLKGLKKDAVYRLTELNKGDYSRLGDLDGKTFTGELLMVAGIRFPMYNEYESTVFSLTQQ
jgi:alpha-galactosidase